MSDTGRLINCAFLCMYLDNLVRSYVYVCTCIYVYMYTYIYICMLEASGPTYHCTRCPGSRESEREEGEKERESPRAEIRGSVFKVSS